MAIELGAEAKRHVRLGLLGLLLLGIALALWLGPLSGAGALPGAPIILPWWALVLAFVAAELLVVHRETRSEAQVFTFTEIAYVVGFVLATPSSVIMGRVLGGLVALALVRRQSFPKLYANLTMATAEAAIASTIFHLVIRSGSPVEPLGWLASFAATLAALMFGVVAIAAAIAIYSGWQSWRMLRDEIVLDGSVTLANTAIGLVLVTTIWNESSVGILLAAVAAVLFLLHRAYVQLTERHMSLETLHDFTRALGGPLELDEVEQTVLQGARTILRAEHGALLLPPVRDGEPATRLFADGDEVIRTSISQSELAADLAVLLPDGAPRLIVAGKPLPPWLARIGVTDGVVVPLVADGLPSGAMVVVNRLTEVATFIEEDLQLLGTLANHGGVALENGRLVVTLQHEAAEKAYQALHDPVTDLPNRASLTEELGHAVARARLEGHMAALVFVDLDTFKEVNDTLGTATGDHLLREVRDRLDALVPTDAFLARFQGDVFAVLLPAVDDAQHVIRLAETLHAGFDEPFVTDAVSLVLGASVGIAVYPEHASTADLLLQRADAATYTARLEGSGIELYRPDADPYAPRRLALAADLREALERDEVDVYVQPKLSIADATVRGAEALVRWAHLRHGPMAPDQFIPAAEHTGVIRALTLYVVRGALAQCRSWRDAGHDLTVAVNLSARNLFDGHLVDDIGELIAAAGVPPAALTLELTESTVMGESRRSMEVLDGLHELGVAISVDDFGTGYSSLTHLRRLPISELKIDKSFVSTMTVNEHDAVIVKTLVELGRNLGLRTVAEGVESQDAWDLLHEAGCEQAQGYLLSRPLPADQFVTWLQRQEVASLAPPDGVVPLRPPRRDTGTDAGG